VESSKIKDAVYWTTGALEYAGKRDLHDGGGSYLKKNKKNKWTTN
jgi:hypothetical protein